VHRRTCIGLLRNTFRGGTLLSKPATKPRPPQVPKANTPQRYNPELQKRSLERRQEKQEDFDNFVGRLKEYSKSEKPSKPPLSNPRPRQEHQTNFATVWAAWEKDVERRRAVHAAEQVQAQRAEQSASEALRQEIKGSLK
jgi:hypothetical protein